MLGKYSEDAIALQIYGLVLILATVMRLVLFAYMMRGPALLSTGQAPERLGLGLSIAGAPILYFLLVMLLRDRRGTCAEADEFS